MFCLEVGSADPRVVISVDMEPSSRDRANRIRLEVGEPKSHWSAKRNTKNYIWQGVYCQVVDLFQKKKKNKDHDVSDFL
ncbi:hypothetical protein BS78_05G211500 [Paspalum vaginatum]|nr:hypothetical protein BS78_05G211500 [Paspalum vaginatum]